MIDPPSEPPADVASDPARLRWWNERWQRHYAQLDSDDDVFDASGCGHEDRYACEPGVDTDFFCRSTPFRFGGSLTTRPEHALSRATASVRTSRADSRTVAPPSATVTSGRNQELPCQTR